MMSNNSVYWDYDSWGSTVPPKNWEQICSVVNEKLKEIIESKGGELEAYLSSESWWEQYCREDEIFGIKSDWTEEENE